MLEMNRKQRMVRVELMRALQCAAALSALAIAADCGAADDAAPSRPNIVVFITDDQGQPECAPFGSRDFPTPNMQRLADAGLAFTRAYVASPTCAPSRGALLTGLMPARNGAEPNHSRPRSALKKWPAWFKELGYKVVAFGKVAHYGQAADYGFDQFAYDGFHEDVCVQAAVDFLQKRSADDRQPLCLMVGTNWPHVPWPEASDGLDPARLSLPAGSIDTPLTRQWRARFGAAVGKADDDLGRIYDTARSVLGDQTLFLFSSDNGTQWPFAKWNCYEAGIRVPLIVAWPGVVKPGTRTDAMVSWVDILPTLVEAAGGSAPGGLDGRSFLPVLKSRSADHRDRIFATHSGDGRWNIYPIRSVRDDRWKFIRNLHPEYAFTTHIDLPGVLGQRTFFSTWEAAAGKDDKAAAIVRRYHARPAEELYDLHNDPDEQHNLAGDPACADQLKRLRDELDAWMREQGDRQKVFAEPRLLSDERSFGPDAPSGAPQREGKTQPKKKPQ